MAAWKRSAAIRYPAIWTQFVMQNPATNQVQLFWIMDVPESLYEYVISVLAQLNYQDTPIERRPGLLNDQFSITERDAWRRKVLEQRLSLICYTKYPDENVAIVAVDINVRRSQFDKEPKFQGALMKRWWSLQKHIFGKKPFYDDFKVAEVIVGVGGFTRHEFCGTHVSVEMLNCRGKLCEITGIRLSLGNFEIREGQNGIESAADKAGYVDYVRVPYEELESMDGSYWIPKCEFFRLMFHLYDSDL